MSQKHGGAEPYFRGQPSVFSPKQGPFSALPFLLITRAPRISPASPQGPAILHRMALPGPTPVIFNPFHLMAHINQLLKFCGTPKSILCFLPI